MASMTHNTPGPALPDELDAPGDAAVAPQVTVSHIVRLRGAERFPLASWRQLRRLALLLAIGLPAIMLAFHFLDPGASAPYIVLPVLAGGLLPLMLTPSGRFEVVTEGDALVLAGALEEPLAALGYERVDAPAGTIRYGARAQVRARPVSVTVGARKLAVTGPVAVLRCLRQQLAG
jgi:hypothetical protein